MVNPLPSYDIDDETIVCLNPLPDNPIEIGTSNWLGASDPTIYTFNWTRRSRWKSEPAGKTGETIKVDKGVYTLY